jgi:uncharacterized protein YegL
MRKEMPKKIAARFLPALLLAVAVITTAQAQTEKKSASAILIDNTGSLRAQFSDVLSAGQGIVDETYKRGPVSIFNFVTKGEKRDALAVISSGSEWTQDRDALDDYLADLWVVAGQTTLMDAINSMAEQLNAKVKEDKDAFGEKAIYLVTDGEERDSRIKEKQLIQNLKESGIKVYAVGLVTELGKEGGLVRKSSREEATSFLTKITKETGGRVVFAKSKNDVNALLQELFAK